MKSLTYQPSKLITNSCFVLLINFRASSCICSSHCTAVSVTHYIVMSQELERTHSSKIFTGIIFKVENTQHSDIKIRFHFSSSVFPLILIAFTTSSCEHNVYKDGYSYYL